MKPQTMACARGFGPPPALWYDRVALWSAHAPV